MSETKADLEARVAELEEQNARLRADLDAARAGTATARPANPEPRFELTAGEQAELQTTGVTRSLRTGLEITADEHPDFVDLDALSDTARANMQAAKERAQARKSQG